MVTPSKLVKTLNWNNSSVLLSLNITDSRIGVAYASTPDMALGGSSGNDDRWSNASSDEVHRIEPLNYMPCSSLKQPINRRKETMRIANELYEIAMDVKAAGFFIAWPVTPQGRLGADCGKVLHVLDALAERPGGPLVTMHKPCCLWNINSNPSKGPPKALARKSPKKNWLVPEKMARKLVEKERQEAFEAKAAAEAARRGDESEVASLLLQDFIDLNWRPLNSQLHRKEAEECLLSNRRLNDSFSKIDDHNEAQLGLLM